MSDVNTFSQNLDSNPFFQSLPIYVQENIKQSGVKISNETDLRKCAENLMNSGC
ncbi:hypothetical protein [Youxingia wuxianensis]|uniref:Uncharacterized protein n=1 Tax=Youxingia wuxianensis TaxID=2763678 RepID=A0A926ES89_9FIRM|nr:hypothetical protein [Youxingia wuxianensis]MBC8585559.1 hypothetical protein [Youxingia wuxianensis]